MKASWSAMCKWQRTEAAEGTLSSTTDRVQEVVMMVEWGVNAGCQGGCTIKLFILDAKMDKLNRK